MYILENESEAKQSGELREAKRLLSGMSERQCYVLQQFFALNGGKKYDK